MAHYLFQREELKYIFVKEVNADVNSEHFDQRALQLEGVHYDANMDTAVVAAESKEQAEQLLNV